MKKVFVIIGMIILTPSVSRTETGYNDELKSCLSKYNYSPDLFDTYNFNNVARCAAKARNRINQAKTAELKDFLKHNPRYRVPGQSLNRCFGKPREMPFEKSSLEVGPNGVKAQVWYKDKLPAGCFENAPWDNRDKLK